MVAIAPPDASSPSGLSPSSCFSIASCLLSIALILATSCARAFVSTGRGIVPKSPWRRGASGMSESSPRFLFLSSSAFWISRAVCSCLTTERSSRSWASFSGSAPLASKSSIAFDSSCVLSSSFSRLVFVAHIEWNVPASPPVCCGPPLHAPPSVSAAGLPSRLREASCVTAGGTSPVSSSCSYPGSDWRVPFFLEPPAPILLRMISRFLSM